MVTLPAHLVATPVLERLSPGPHEGVVLGAGTTAAWVDLDGFVIAITTREVPLLPNAIALAAGSGALVGRRRCDRPARPGRVALGSVQVTWDPVGPPGWDPTVPVLPAPRRRRSRRGRGAASRPRVHLAAANGADPDRLVRELGRIGLATAVDPGGAAGLRLVFRGVRERDPEPALAGAGELLGRGPGLTPEGDDLLAAVAGTLAVLGPATGMDGPFLKELLAALLVPAGRPPCRRRCSSSPPVAGCPSRPGDCSTWAPPASGPGRRPWRGCGGSATAAAGPTRPGSPPPPACSPPPTGRFD